MLKLPKEAVAARSKKALQTLGELKPLGRFAPSSVLLLEPRDGPDDCQVWVHRNYGSYRDAWKKAVDLGHVDALDDATDVDHVYARTFARIEGFKMDWLRLHAVWAEVNQEAGRSIEKLRAHELKRAKVKVRREIIYATETQILKMLCHPVGTFADPEELFD